MIASRHRRLGLLSAALVLAAARIAHGGDVSGDALDAAAHRAAAKDAADTTVTGATGGSIGMASAGVGPDIEAQASLPLTNEAVNFLAQIRRISLSSWLALDAVTELTPLDVPSFVESAARTDAATLKRVSYQTIGARLTFGKGIGTDLRGHDDDAEVSSCCSLRAAVASSVVSDDDRAQCASDPDPKKCEFTRKLASMNLTDKAAPCSKAGVPLDVTSVCTAADIMSLRFARAAGPRLVVGFRFLYPGSTTVTTGKGLSFELQFAYAWASGYVFVSASGLALQSWEETMGNDKIQHLDVLEGRASAGVHVSKGSRFRGDLFASAAANRWSDDAVMFSSSGRRFEAGANLAVVFEGYAAALKFTVVKPFTGDAGKFDDYQIGFAIIPSVGGSFE